jgi:hypothetical protein
MEYLAHAASYLRYVWAAIDLKTLVLLFGATWAFYKLVQSGGLHPLLDLKVSGKFIWIAGREYLLCSMEVKNVHLPMVLIEYSGLRLSLMLEHDDPSLPVLWSSWATFPVFEGQEKVWSSETIRDRILLVAPGKENVFHIEFRIARKYKWYQRSYKWITGRSSWSAVAIVTRATEEKAGRNEGNDPGRRRRDRSGNAGLEKQD